MVGVSQGVQSVKQVLWGGLHSPSKTKLCNITQQLL